MSQQLIFGKLRPQYHFQPSKNGYYAWDVLKLIKLSKELDVVEVELSEIKELDQNYWFQEVTPTCRNMLTHLILVEKVDLKYPIILAKERFVMDGMHRVMKALKLEHTTITAVVFNETPKPDFVDVQPDELSYE